MVFTAINYIKIGKQQARIVILPLKQYTSSEEKDGII